MLEEGLTHTSTLVVAREHTAVALGSGDMDVLATPAMMALMENAAMWAVAHALPEGSTTVGGSMTSSHLHPSKIGTLIAATALLEKIEGRKLTFRVEARQHGTVIGEGVHVRFIVDRETFLAKLG